MKNQYEIIVQFIHVDWISEMQMLDQENYCSCHAQFVLIKKWDIN